MYHWRWTYRLYGTPSGTILVTVLLIMICNATHAATLKVGANEGLQSLRMALSECLDGDTIVISKGYYAEAGIQIDKEVTVIGENWPVIDGAGLGEVIHITASNVHLSGLVVRGAPVSFVDDNAGIKLEGARNCSIEGNRLENNFFAIYLAKSADCVIRNNTIQAVKSTETRSGNGIHLWYCNNITVSDNSITGHRDGIYFEFVKHSHITGNESRDNVRYGLHFMFSDSCVYRNNLFFDNGAGVAVMYTHHVQMIGNRFERNWGPSSFGLLLKEISDSEVRENTFAKNSIGIYVEGCNRVLVESNVLKDNGWAIELMANSMDNRFVRNNFMGNSFSVATNSRQNFNHFAENYWSEYGGYDLDRDGYGDVPFRPVSLLSMLVQQNPPTLVLLHSLTVQALDLAERLLPSLTPETLIDTRPAMGPYR